MTREAYLAGDLSSAKVRAIVANLNDDTAAAYANWTLGKNLYDVESQYLRDNAIMHKIPLIGNAA